MSYTLADFEQEQERGALTGGLEVRSMPTPVAEARADDDADLRIVGFGSVADQPTTIEGMFSDWDEEVAPGAWKKTIAESQRILSMFNHDPGRLLGATDAGTLRLSDVKNGLLYDVDVNPDDPMALSVHAQVIRGDVHGSSVWLRVVRQEITNPDESNGLERPLRRILEASLFETGPVAMPAFPQTTATARSLDAMLRSSGMADGGRRARLTVATLVDPAYAADEFRAWLSQNPEVREAVCACKVPEVDHAAGDPAPGSETPARSGHLSTSAQSFARARLALTGLR